MAHDEFDAQPSSKTDLAPFPVEEGSLNIFSIALYQDYAVRVHGKFLAYKSGDDLNVVIITKTEPCNNQSTGEAITSACGSVPIQ